MATDYIRGSVGQFDDYVNAVANTELMFLTNMAATKVIQAAGLALREGSMAAVGAIQQLATDGELDYGELAMNLVINTVVDVGMDALTGSIPGGGGRSKGGSGGLGIGGENATAGATKLVPHGEGEQFGINALKADPLDGYYDVIIHGSVNSD